MPGPALLVLLLLLPGAALAAGTTAVAPPATPAPTPAPAQSPAPEPAKPPPAKPPPPAMREQVHPADATAVLGRDVKDTKGDNLGHIVNVLVDSAGLPRAAVIEVGGFLGVGTRRIAVAWRALTFPPDQPQGPATLDMTLDQIKNMPEYQDTGGNKPVTIATPPPAAAPAAQSH